MAYRLCRHSSVSCLFACIYLFIVYAYLKRSSSSPARIWAWVGPVLLLGLLPGLGLVRVLYCVWFHLKSSNEKQKNNHNNSLLCQRIHNEPVRLCSTLSFPLPVSLSLSSPKWHWTVMAHEPRFSGIKRERSLQKHSRDEATRRDNFRRRSRPKLAATAKAVKKLIKAASWAQSKDVNCSIWHRHWHWHN